MAVIFKEYVEKMYALRQQYSKDNPMNLVAKLLMNSLYGKFGLNPQNDVAQVLDLKDPKTRSSFFDNADGKFNPEHISDLIKIDERFYVVVHKNVSNFIHDEDDLYHGIDVNIAIASSITALGRLWMSDWKNREDTTLYYSDTDSIVIDRPLPDAYVGTGLGKYKLEYEISSAVFLAPKVYGFKTLDGEEHIKVKGVKKEHLKDFHLDDMRGLLVKDAKVEFTQTKWYKKRLEGTIEIAEVAYQLQATSNKRIPIYTRFSGGNFYSDTVPYRYSDLEQKSGLEIIGLEPYENPTTQI